MVWDMREKTAEMSQAGMHHLVVKKGRDLVCFASYLETEELDASQQAYPVLYIYEFHVLPAYQRRGVGSWLMESALLPALAEANIRGKPMMLTVQSANTAAVAFYRKHGFAPDRVHCPSLHGSSALGRCGYYIMSRPIEAA